MPINSAILKRIADNDPALKNLDLSVSIEYTVDKTSVDYYYRMAYSGAKSIGDYYAAENKRKKSLQLDDQDILEIVKALKTNTYLISLNLRGNNISSTGAIALANTDLSSLNLANNQIGNEGAKALATNTTLTTLIISGNEINEEWRQKLQEMVGENKRQLIKRRDQFVQTILTLARDYLNPSSQSLWHLLPKEIMIYIICLSEFRPQQSLGKSDHQVLQFTQFVFEAVTKLSEILKEAKKTNQNFKIIEKRITDRDSKFRFFPQPLISETISSLKHEEEVEKNIAQITL